MLYLSNLLGNALHTEQYQGFHARLCCPLLTKLHHGVFGHLLIMLACCQEKSITPRPRLSCYLSSCVITPALTTLFFFLFEM